MNHYIQQYSIALAVEWIARQSTTKLQYIVSISLITRKFKFKFCPPHKTIIKSSADSPSSSTANCNYLTCTTLVTILLAYSLSVVFLAMYISGFTIEFIGMIAMVMNNNIAILSSDVIVSKRFKTSSLDSFKVSKLNFALVISKDRPGSRQNPGPGQNRPICRDPGPGQNREIYRDSDRDSNI